MDTFNTAVASLLTGALSQQAQGFLLVLPNGATGRARMELALAKVYGTAVHPDVFVLQNPEGGTVKIDEVRTALQFAHTYPAGSLMKTIWVPEADTMTQQAENAFLKTLEEPSSRTRVVLGTSRPERLLPTTRSRCIPIAVRGDVELATEELAALTPESNDAERATAFRLTNGTVDAAARLVKAKGGVAWAEATAAALAKGQLMPVPPLGTTGIDAPTFGFVVQTILAQIARTNPDKAGAMADAAAPYLLDCTRPGLDMGGRTRALARAMAET
jgi:DNA polymerase III, delta subunit